MQQEAAAARHTAAVSFAVVWPGEGAGPGLFCRRDLGHDLQLSAVGHMPWPHAHVMEHNVRVCVMIGQVQSGMAQKWCSGCPVMLAS